MQESKDEKQNIFKYSDQMKETFSFFMSHSSFPDLSLSPPSSYSVGLHETERPASEKGEFILAHMP